MCRLIFGPFWRLESSSPRSPIVCRLAKVLCVPENELVGLSEEPRPRSGCSGQYPRTRRASPRPLRSTFWAPKGFPPPTPRPSTTQKAHVRRRKALPYGCALHLYAGKPTGTRVRRDLPVVLNELLFPHQRAEIFASPHIAVV